MNNNDDIIYPTIIAIRNGNVIGMISTSKGEHNLIAAPMIANSIFVCIGLYELYEKTLENIGVKHYLFSIDTENLKMINTVKKLFNIEPFTITDDLAWYVRRLAYVE